MMSRSEVFEESPRGRISDLHAVATSPYLPLSTPARLVLVSLHYHADVEEGETFVSNLRICRETGLGDRTVLRAVVELVLSGIVVSRTGPDGRSCTTGLDGERIAELAERRKNLDRASRKAKVDAMKWAEDRRRVWAKALRTMTMAQAFEHAERNRQEAAATADAS